MQNIVLNIEMMINKEGLFEQVWGSFKIICTLMDESREYSDLCEELMATLSKNLWVLNEKYTIVRDI